MLADRHRLAREQSWAPAAALLVRRTSFDRAGGFDESFDPVALCEDVDLCCRLRAAGERIGYVGEASLRHYEGTTFNHIGVDKLAIWKGHVRVLRARWHREFASGPIHQLADLAWRPVLKDYADVARPRVSLLATSAPAPTDATFFATDATLSAGRPAPDVRVGIVGCGQAAVKGALPALAARQRRGDAPPAAPFLDFGPVQGVRVSGVADPDLVNLLAAAQWYAVPHATRDASALLDTVPAEGVVICTPPQWHSKIAVEALRRGLHVLVEKPAVLTRDALDELLAAMRARPEQHVVVNLPWSCHPALGVLRQLAGTATTGDVRSFHVVFEHSGPQAWAPRASWYREAPGGVVTDLGLHVLDAVGRAIGTPLGQLRAESGWVTGTPPARARAEVTAAGVRGEVEVSWEAPAPRFTIAITCDLATLHASLIPYRTAGQAVEVRTAEGVRRIAVPDSGPAGDGPYAEFVAALRGGPSPRTSLPALAEVLRTMIDWSAAIPARPVPVIGGAS